MCTRCPSKILTKRKSIEMTFIYEYQVLWQKMFPHKHLGGSMVIFIAFDGRARNLTGPS